MGMFKRRPYHKIFTLNDLSKVFSFLSLLFLSFLLIQCSPTSSLKAKTENYPLTPKSGNEIAAFAEGCFWCSEHIFESIPGVEEVISGYAGGHTKLPTYDSVNTETTGHAETVLVVYDPKKINYAELCRIFFLSHDPTTKDRQGPDSGSSYRSILFYRTSNERLIAKEIQKEIETSKVWRNPIVTEIIELREFTKAEEYHQDFIQKNPSQSYVQHVSMPRFEEFKLRYANYKQKKK